MKKFLFMLMVALYLSFTANAESKIQIDFPQSYEISADVGFHAMDIEYNQSSFVFPDARDLISIQINCNKLSEFNYSQDCSDRVILYSFLYGILDTQNTLKLKAPVFWFNKNQTVYTSKYPPNRRTR